jgi:hypothetical protein
MNVIQNMNVGSDERMLFSCSVIRRQTVARASNGETARLNSDDEISGLR